MKTNTFLGDETPSINRLLKPEEVAAMLSISKSFAYHLLQTGAIPVVRLGKACRVRPKDLAAFVENNLHNGVNIP
jgi:excisionase family DNA binding protein